MANNRKKGKNKAGKASVGNASNCNETCSSYDYCVKEGNTKRFVPGGTCADFSKKKVGEKGETTIMTPEEALKDPTIILSSGDVVPPELYTRARKTIGMTDVQIRRYPDTEALKQALNGMHPNSNPDARVTEGKPPKNPIFEDNMPDSFTLESVLEARLISTNREHFDRNTLEAFLRQVNRRYGIHKPVRILQDRSFKVVKRELVTKFNIYFK